MATRTVYTIGHSNHPEGVFFDLLATHAIDALVDVRSQPTSRYCPHFDRAALESSLPAHGRQYEFLGHALGGRPADARFYDPDGHVLYHEVARSPALIRGIEQLEHLAERMRIALLCGEEDPRECHRHLLIGRVLKERGVDVAHIRGDGTLTTSDELEARRGGRQLELFGDREPNTWKSTQSVLPKSPPASSSEPCARRGSSGSSTSA